MLILTVGSGHAPTSSCLSLWVRYMCDTPYDLYRGAFLNPLFGNRNLFLLAIPKRTSEWGGEEEERKRCPTFTDRPCLLPSSPSANDGERWAPERKIPPPPQPLLFLVPQKLYNGGKGGKEGGRGGKQASSRKVSSPLSRSASILNPPTTPTHIFPC